MIITGKAFLACLTHTFNASLSHLQIQTETREGGGMWEARLKWWNQRQEWRKKGHTIPVLLVWFLSLIVVGFVVSVHKAPQPSPSAVLPLSRFPALVPSSAA